VEGLAVVPGGRVPRQVELLAARVLDQQQVEQPEHLAGVLLGRRDEYLFTTDAELTPDAVVSTYCGRWSIETTFQEARSALGLETTRGRCRSTVVRAAPCLFGLYTVVAVLFHALPVAKRVGAVAWPGKATVTFSDVLSAVRRWLWDEAILPQAGSATALRKLPEPVRELLFTTLAPAA
jgi:hypothetical protein